ncbi:MAG: hypothetical protein EA426_12940, partial [Spirochaetaceae bacterium]
MKPSRVPILAFFAVAAIGMTTCENAMLTTVTAVVTEYQKPKATVNFESGSGLAEDTEIVITFTGSIKPETLTLGGILGDAAAGAVWSAGTDAEGESIENAVLTLRPAETWPLGSDKDLIVTGADVQEFALDPIEATYGVLDGVVYVHASLGSDFNPGTIDQPKRSISAAVREAERVFDEADVHVAGGLYQVTSTTVVTKDISLYGGFDPDDWSARDPAVHETKWDNIRTSGSHATLSYQPGVDEVVLDGFTITAGNGNIALNDATAAIFVSSASPVIRNNTIVTGIAARANGILASSASFEVVGNTFKTLVLEAVAVCIDAADSTVLIADNMFTGNMVNEFYGLMLNNSVSVVERNLIDADQPMQLAFGINVFGGSAVIRNNVISAGYMFTEDVYGQYGVFLNGCAATLHNNTIDGGDGLSADGIMTTAIMLYRNVTSTIENNVIFTSGGDLRTGVWQRDAASFPDEFNNNVMFGCPDGNYYHDPSVTGWVHNVSEPDGLEDFLGSNGVTAAGNVFLTGD